jgi:hypothetical protein
MMVTIIASSSGAVIEHSYGCAIHELKRSYDLTQYPLQELYALSRIDKRNMKLGIKKDLADKRSQVF